MRTCIVLILFFALTIVPLQKPLGQTPADKDQDVEKVVVGTNEVVLDAVVKDKKGHAVKDLAAADFEISEDGVPQEVRSFRLVTRDPAPINAPDSKPGAAQPRVDAKKSQTENTNSTDAARAAGPFKNPIHFGALALVFDRLSPNARSIARQASLSYVAGLRRDD